MLRELINSLPPAKYIYLADTAHFPYGPWPAEDIRRFMRSIITYLQGRGCDLVIVACNTSSAAGLPAMRAEFSVPLFDVLSPGAREAARRTSRGKVAVIATEGTVRSGAYERAIRAASPTVEVISRPCPSLVEIAERGWDIPDAVKEREVRRCLGPLLSAGIDVLVLGCTHYLLLMDVFQRVVPPGVDVINPALSLAAEVRSALSDHSSGAVDLEFLTTGFTDSLEHMVEKVLGQSAVVSRVSLEAHLGGLDACSRSPL